MTKPTVPTNQTGQAAILAVPMALFPTLGSLQEVVDFAESKLPITSKNDLTILLYTYHNTLLGLMKPTKE